MQFHQSIHDNLISLVVRLNIEVIILSSSSGKVLLQAIHPSYTPPSNSNSNTNSSPNSLTPLSTVFPQVFTTAISQLANLPQNHFGKTKSITSFFKNTITTHCNFSPLVVTFLICEEKDSKGGDSGKGGGSGSKGSKRNTVNVGGVDCCIETLREALEPVRLAVELEQAQE